MTKLNYLIEKEPECCVMSSGDFPQLYAVTTGTLDCGVRSLTLSILSICPLCPGICGK